MGCDIHLFLEKKDSAGVWISQELYIKNNYEDEPDYEISSVFSNRDYSLFAALCGVRDYSPGASKISEPKGQPFEPMSKETAIEYVAEEGYCHSHSWNTLEELYSFAKRNEFTPHSGLISTKQSEALDRGIVPESWCQGSTDESLVWREWKEKRCPIDGLIEAIKYQLKNHFYVWHPEKEAENIRIVYWFDN